MYVAKTALINIINVMLTLISDLIAHEYDHQFTTRSCYAHICYMFYMQFMCICTRTSWLHTSIMQHIGGIVGYFHAGITRMLCSFVYAYCRSKLADPLW